MLLQEKYEKWLELYEKYYICRGDAKTISGLNIPVQTVLFTEDGTSTCAEVGDGTINIALDLQFSYILLLRAIKENNQDNVTKYKQQIQNSLNALYRLEEKAYQICCEQYPIKNINILDGKQKGFFLRDDFDKDFDILNTKQIIGSYNRCITMTQEEDPCHSPFTSQDQIWNLAPILLTLSRSTSILLPDSSLQAEIFSLNMFQWVIDNHHTIYNPYYSAIYHFWKYLPSMNEDKVKPWDRVKDRKEHYKPKIKVKRGANNWYFAYGFKKAFEAVGDYKLNWFSKFISACWYKPFIFLADRIYYPIVKRWISPKETSYYSLAVASDGKAWYGGDYQKRLVNRFNKSLEQWEKDNSASLFMPELTFLINQTNKINYTRLASWLIDYPEPIPGKNISPITFLLLYNWYYYKGVEVK